MKRELMIDLETLDTNPFAAILQAAGMWFDSESGEPPTVAFNHFLPVQPQLDEGRTISWDTLQWWSKQEFFGELFSKEREANVGFIQHSIMLAVNQADTIWANSPQFDAVILSSWLKNKWPFWKDRDVRTLKNIRKDDFTTFDAYRPPVIMQHNALDDCKLQVYDVQFLTKLMNNDTHSRRGYDAGNPVRITDGDASA